MYTYLTQYNSPNFTPNAKVKATYGRPRTIEAIAIHWWDSPDKNPSFEGVIQTLCNPKRQASAHFVATGTGRRVACLVNLPDASWATNNANPYTISIECDPRCRAEDYDVIAELIAELRREYGNLPLVPHKQFKSTACPGNYDLNRLSNEANKKLAGATFGTSTGKPVVVVPPPVVTPPPANSTPQYSALYNFATYVFNKDSNLYDFVAKKNIKTFTKGQEVDIVAQAVVDGKTYLMTAYSYDGGKIKASTGFLSTDLEVKVPTPNPEPPKPVDPPKTPTLEDRIGDIDRRLSTLEAIVQKVVDFLKGIFVNFKQENKYYG